jgi:hypothetical protein
MMRIECEVMATGLLQLPASLFPFIYNETGN